MLPSNEYGIYIELMPMEPFPDSPFQDADDRQRQAGLEGEVAFYERLVLEDPKQAAAHHNLAIALRKLNRPEEALRRSKIAFELSPEHSTLAFSLGLSFEQAGYLPEAEDMYRQALLLEPNHPGVLNNLGRLLDSQGHHTGALDCLEKAALLSPEDPDIALNLANTFLALGRPTDAQRLLTSAPQTAAAANALGISLYVQRDWQSASACFRHATKLSPGFAGAHENLALSLLHEEKFEEGWREYQWRWSNPDNGLTPRLPAMPHWDGSCLGDRKLLLHAEQGFGDTLQFVRFGSLIPKSGGNITLAVQAELVSLLAGMPWADEVISLDEGLPSADVHAPLANLPSLLNPTGHLVRSTGAYLSLPDPSLRFPASTDEQKTEVRIGVCWAGRPRHEEDPYRNRSCPAEAFQPITELEGVRLVSLQTGLSLDKMEAEHGAALFDQPDLPLTTFLETAHEVLRMDLIITVDTAIAHLCGALNKPGIVLLPYAADWRWGSGNGPAPWYPSLEMIRQEVAGTWSTVFERAILQINKQYLLNQR
ncbi:MAG: hypothetical protein CMM45_02405 [Rhodospirillaceae bacterium]|nr:hypothetical protein [Rhodospirillaceae bacterium]